MSLGDPNNEWCLSTLKLKFKLSMLITLIWYFINIIITIILKIVFNIIKNNYVHSEDPLQIYIDIQQPKIK